MTKLPVVAAIPNYNMATELNNLLPQVVKQGYDAIFVLDDFSTDNSRQIVEAFGYKVRFVAGKINKGAGGNRNRIIKALDTTTIIHFLDADVQLETDETANLVRQVVPNTPFGFVVGLAKTPEGLQNAWNYGTGVGLRSDISAQIQLLISTQVNKHPERAAHLRQLFRSLVTNWPDPLTPPVRCRVYWGIEQNLIVRSDTFARFGGFNENLRETEILELAMRMHKQDLPCYFDPSISVRHTEGKVRHYNRGLLKLREQFRIDHEYGLWKWLVSDGKIK
jgi:glycosyltransferase involved in cell wall biosynthesis